MSDAVNEAKTITAHKNLVIFTLKKLYDASFDFKASKPIIKATNTQGRKSKTPVLQKKVGVPAEYQRSTGGVRYSIRTPKYGVLLFLPCKYFR